jgi:CheY-like chemotaxis protein
VETAPGSVVAVERIAQRQASLRKPFGLLMLDSEMPGTDSGDLIKRMREAGLDARIITMTPVGSTYDAGLSRKIRIAGSVNKPLRRSELWQTLNRVLASSEHAVGAAHGESEFSPLRILLAEDNPVNRKVATRLIERLGHVPTVVHNGREALDAIVQGSYDALLMDVQMPEMDGYEATSAIRELERATGGHLPIIAVTAHAMSGDDQKCLDAGMDAYLSKPIDPGRLGELIDLVTGRFAAIV